jgi:gamma-D-glutamyl-L-lysine dipeptidyl-peptidase
MWKLSTLSFVLALILVSCSPKKGPTVVDDLVNDARKKLAPDRRTLVFDVQTEQKGDAVILRGEVHNLRMKEQLLATVAENSKLQIIDSIVVLPQPALGEKIYALVSVSVANIRSKPAQKAEMVTQARLGMPLRLLRKESGWYYVQTPDDYLGWTKDVARAMTAAEFMEWAARPKLMATARLGTTRQSHAPGSPIVSDFVAGSLFELRKALADGYEVGYPDGRAAFLEKSAGVPYTAWLAAAKDSPENIVATARTFFGVPYLWGGTSSKGFDCSGFAQTVFWLNGTLLPRDAGQQWDVGEPVDTSSGFAFLRPGDLVFFGDGKPSGPRPKVDHVGISLGGGAFIHAPSSGGLGIRTNNLIPGEHEYSASLRESFLGARRMIGNGVRRLDSTPYYNGHAY